MALEPRTEYLVRGTVVYMYVYTYIPISLEYIKKRKVRMPIREVRI